jgi:hypothetical protein
LQRKERGCDARQLADGTWESPAVMPLRIDEIEDYACPRRPIKDDPDGFGRLMRLHRYYRQGMLPDPGSITQQASRGLELLELVEVTLGECRKTQEEQEAARQNRR